MSAACVTLREISAATVRAICELEIKATQRGFVAPNAVDRTGPFEPAARFRAVYADDTPVGFVMWKAGSDDGVRYLWRFMIEGRHQGQGYGRRALDAVIDLARVDGCTHMTLSYVVGEGGPSAFYGALGFDETGETLPNGERIMRLSL